MNSRRQFILEVLTLLRKILKLVLDWPIIHTSPSRVTALKLLGFSAAPQEGNAYDATRPLPQIAVGTPSSEQTLLELAYRQVMTGKDHEAQQDVLRRIQSARSNIQIRSKARGASVMIMLVFVGFLVAAQVTIILSNGSGYQKLAIKPTIFGLLVILWGVLPTSGSLLPRYRGDEGSEALTNSEFDWFCEDVSRSSAQRQQLWRLRVAFAFSLLCTSVTVLMLLFA